MLSHAWQDYYSHAIRKSNTVPSRKWYLLPVAGVGASVELRYRYGGAEPGRISGSPEDIPSFIKPSSWGGVGNTGEHGASEPGDRAPDRSSRLKQAEKFTCKKFKIFFPEWYRSCGCYLSEIFR